MFNLSFSKALALVFGGILTLASLFTLVGLVINGISNGTIAHLAPYITLAVAGVLLGHFTMHKIEHHFLKAWDKFLDITVWWY